MADFYVVSVDEKNGTIIQYAMNNQTRPLLICMSATRNYGWITRAFLKANSQWADYIIIVDQMSTDGTREMCEEYDSVIILDDTDLSYSETRRSEMALKRAREIEGDKILVSLDIDEVLPVNWMDTADGKMVLASKPKDMFVLDWANILPDKEHYKATHANNMYRVFHDDGETPYDNGGLDMHTHHLPYCYHGGQERKIGDFPILHFGYYNTLFQYVKMRYYQMVDYDKNNKSVIKLSRYYHQEVDNVYKDGDYSIDKNWMWDSFDVFDMVDVDTPPFLCNEMKKFIERNGIEHYRNLDIWDDKILDCLQMNDPRTFWIRILHGYLHYSQPYRKTLLVRAMDAILKRLFRRL